MNLKSRYLLAIPSIAASPKLLRLTAYGGIPWFKKNKAFTEKTNIPPIGLGTDKILTQSNGSTSLDQINAETRSWTSSVMTSMDRSLCLKFSSQFSVMRVSDTKITGAKSQAIWKPSTL